MTDDDSGESLLALLGEHSNLVLVANSEAADLAAIRRDLPANALFIFFNEVTRVLREPFGAPAVVVARSGRDGPAVLRKGKMPALLARFQPGMLRTVVNLRAGAVEALTCPERFGHSRVDLLDLTDYFRTRYTAGKTPSSGYAMIAWLAANGFSGRMHGIGFTGRRSEKWRVFDVHDWVLERIALRLLEMQANIAMLPTTAETPGTVEALERQFPGVERRVFVELGFEILSQRLERTDLFVDRLWSVTKVERGIREGFKLFRRRKGIRL